MFQVAGAPARPRGFALLIVLWSVVLLALLATTMTAVGRSDLQLASNVRRAAAAEAAADGGIAAAGFHAGEAASAGWAADGQTHSVKVGDYTVAVRVLDENGKLNPNFTPPELMAGVIAALGTDRTRAAAVAQAIAAWRAPDGSGQLADQYRSAAMGAAPTGEPFRSIDEVGLVLGMTPDLLARLRPYLSVYAEGALDVGHAAPLVRGVVHTLTGNDADPPAGRPTIIEVFADARGGGGSAFIRHAVLALGATQDGQPFRTLVWDRPTERE